MARLGVWIRRQAAATAALSLVIALGLLLLGAATDEGALPWRVRLARGGTLTPLAAMWAYLVAIWRVRRRGEALVWESLGLAPRRWLVPLALAALWPVALAAVGFCAALWPVAESGLFPASAPETLCRVADDGFVCEPLGVALREGALLALPAGARASRAPVLPSGVQSAALLVMMSCALLALCARPAYGRGGSWQPVGFAALQLVLCQAVGAERAPWLLAATPSLLLSLACAVRRMRRAKP